jgi:hypothetical protein
VEAFGQGKQNEAHLSFEQIEAFKDLSRKRRPSF